MIIEMTKLLNALSLSLDYVENEIIKTARNHGKRVAVLTNLMAKEAGYSQDVLYALTQSAVLHDCALAEYLKDELSRENKSLDETNTSVPYWNPSYDSKILQDMPRRMYNDGATRSVHWNAQSSVLVNGSRSATISWGFSIDSKNSGINIVDVKVDDKKVRIIGNGTVDINEFVDEVIGHSMINVSGKTILDTRKCCDKLSAKARGLQVSENQTPRRKENRKWNSRDRRPRRT